MSERGTSRLRSRAIEAARKVDTAVASHQRLLRAVTVGGGIADFLKLVGAPPSVSLTVGGINAAGFYAGNVVVDFLNGNNRNDPPTRD